jgi:hypothetical protein
MNESCGIGDLFAANQIGAPMKVTVPVKSDGVVLDTKRPIHPGSPYANSGTFPSSDPQMGKNAGQRDMRDVKRVAKSGRGKTG